MNISGIASTASAEKLDALRQCSLRKAFKRASWNLNGLHLVGKLRQLSETGDCVRRSEGGRLRRDGNADRLAHLPNDRQHSIRFLLAIDTHDYSPCIHHRSRTVGGSMSIRTAGQIRPKSHGTQDRQFAGSTAFNGNQHLLKMKESFKNQEIDTCIREQTNLLSDQIANMGRCRAALTFEKLGSRDRACD